jgi:hypothetical protein
VLIGGSSPAIRPERTSLFNNVDVF